MAQFTALTGSDIVRAFISKAAWYSLTVNNLRKKVMFNSITIRSSLDLFFNINLCNLSDCERETTKKCFQDSTAKVFFNTEGYFHGTNVVPITVLKTVT